MKSMKVQCLKFLLIKQVNNFFKQASYNIFYLQNFAHAEHSTYFCGKADTVYVNIISMHAYGRLQRLQHPPLLIVSLIITGLKGDFHGHI
jgi:hypothetical protein